MATSTKGNTKTATPAKTKAKTTAPATAETAETMKDGQTPPPTTETPADPLAALWKQYAKGETITPENLAFMLESVKAKREKDEPLTGDEALMFVKAKAEEKRTAADRLLLVQAEAKAMVRAARKAVRTETKSAASTESETLIRNYVSGGFVHDISEIDPDVSEVGIPSLVSAIEAKNGGRKVQKLTVRYSVNEKGEPDLKVSFKLAPVAKTATPAETPKDAKVA